METFNHNKKYFRILTDTPNYNIVGNNGEHRVFRIDVGDMTKEELSEYVTRITEKFKRNPLQILDNDVFIPVRNENTISR